MSTRASFIIRKGGIDKELYIPCDGYPSSAGSEVIDLIKTTNVRLLFDLLIPSEDGMDYSFSRCEEAVGKLIPYEYRKMNGLFIQDSLMCEYAYVIDTDEKKLFFYLGFQQIPHKGNRYGDEPKESRTGNLYYPCRLYAVFSFSFIRATETAAIVEIMEKYDYGVEGDIEIFDVPAVVINVAESLSATPTDDKETDNAVDHAILGSIKALLLYGPLGPEMLDDIARLYNVSVDTVKGVIKRMRV